MTPSVPLDPVYPRSPLEPANPTEPVNPVDPAYPTTLVQNIPPVLFAANDWPALPAALLAYKKFVYMLDTLKVVPVIVVVIAPGMLDIETVSFINVGDPAVVTVVPVPLASTKVEPISVSILVLLIAVNGAVGTVNPLML